MPLTKEDGRRIREEYSGVKEKEICEKHNLQHFGGSKTKIDGSDGINNKSIKNASGSSTQVHLTTQKRFIKEMGLQSYESEFVHKFCGNPSIKNNGKDRYDTTEIDSVFVDSFFNFLVDNKKKVIDYIINNGFGITHIVYKDTKNNKEYELKYGEVIAKIENCNWVVKEGGIHLKNKEGKTYFHFQREGKRSKTNRYNVLWHIHKELFK
tara:strand:+ start:806 stop:1432 length:627 start_codon:yes stop_codon:yes gene_type:complete